MNLRLKGMKMNTHRRNLPNNMSLEVYHDMIARAQTKANEFDQSVAIVLRPSGCELVLCPPKGNRNLPDMKKVDELLHAHDDAELLEVVGPEY
jgi:hypothetical protein